MVSPDALRYRTYLLDVMKICEFLIADHERGGTGRLQSTPVLRRLFDLVPAERVFLAGGMTAENVGELVQTYRPVAVDVQSGVIGKDAEHDPMLMRNFVLKVRAVQTGGGRDTNID
jgi:phosphoribosylanthranilate isomerase